MVLVILLRLLFLSLDGYTLIYFQTQRTQHLGIFPAQMSDLWGFSDFCRICVLHELLVSFCSAQIARGRER